MIYFHFIIKEENNLKNEKRGGVICAYWNQRPYDADVND